MHSALQYWIARSLHYKFDLFHKHNQCFNHILQHFRTKVFIRLPKTIFDVEDRFQARKHELVTLITKIWRGRQQRLKYQK